MCALCSGVQIAAEAGCCAVVFIHRLFSYFLAVFWLCFGCVLVVFLVVFLVVCVLETAGGGGLQ